MNRTIRKQRLHGGTFLANSAKPNDVFTPEDLTQEHRQFGAVAKSFADRDISPAIKQIEEKQPGLISELLHKAGALGLLGVDIPEKYGGFALDKVTSALIAEEISVSGSFYVAFSAHAGIGTLPLVWYGTEAQKKQYLPRLASGDCVAAFALSEASSGSDATSISAHATLSADGFHYLLNGEKMWVSNAGIAGLFTIFAKVDGKHFSAFLVDSSSPGLTIGHEEHKMGIRGSSTCPVIMVDCKIPAANLLGQVGKGHQIAFNVLNAGRFKLGAVSLGAAKTVFRGAVRYGKERSAFGQPITDFGLIQEKLADSAARIFAAEALVYRVAGSIDQALQEVDEHSDDAIQQAQQRIEEHVVECSIVKVWCSEMQERVIDHSLQIYGGYGFTEDYPVARMYRDSRVNKIFEGTNEINRLLITRWSMRKTNDPASDLSLAMSKSCNNPQVSPTDSSSLDIERAFVANVKELTLYCLHVAQQKYGKELAEEQEIAAALADLIIETYLLESALLRAAKSGDPLMADLVRYYAACGKQQLLFAAERILHAASETSDLNRYIAVVQRLMQCAPGDSIVVGRRIAKAMIETGQYRV